MPRPNLAGRLASGPPLVLDGGFATELERRGEDLSDPLWSARELLEHPGRVEEVHRDFVQAGADVAIAATYQASYERFADRGLDRRAVDRLLEAAVGLARAAGSPFVVASCGPYGAFLADGSEYTGNYPGADQRTLEAWHRPRFEALQASGADGLACETLPQAAEARALASLIERTGAHAWISFTLRDERHLPDGTPLRDVARQLRGAPGVVALGVNCCRPSDVAVALQELAWGFEGPVLAYPNSGESYDGTQKRWSGRRDSEDFGELARHWHEQGARAVGGCCRTGPEHVRAIAQALLQD